MRHRYDADARVQHSFQHCPSSVGPELGSQWRRDRKVSQHPVLVGLGTGGRVCGDLVIKFHADVAEVNGNQGEIHQGHRVVIGCLRERKIALVEQWDEF